MEMTLEKEKAEFFKAYYIRRKLEEQIMEFNKLLQQQYQLMKRSHLMKVPPSIKQNRIHHKPANSLQHLSIPSGAHQQLNLMDSMANSYSSNRIAPSNFQPMQINSRHAVDSQTDFHISDTTTESDSSRAMLTSSVQPSFAPEQGSSTGNFDKALSLCGQLDGNLNLLEFSIKPSNFIGDDLPDYIAGMPSESQSEAIDLLSLASSVLD